MFVSPCKLTYMFLIQYADRADGGEENLGESIARRGKRGRGGTGERQALTLISSANTAGTSDWCLLAIVARHLLHYYRAAGKSIDWSHQETIWSVLVVVAIWRISTCSCPDPLGAVYVGEEFCCSLGGGGEV